MPSITALLGHSPPCPHCDHHMALKTDADRERGYCSFCAMTKFKHLSGFKLFPDPPAKVWGNPPLQRVTYRTEGDAYDEGIFDDD